MNEIECDRKTVLLIDDDRDFLFQEQVQLEAAGFRAIGAESKDQALRVLSQTRPDLVIVDVMMEDADAGFTLCHAIKNKDATIPVVMVTSVISETGLAFDASTAEERSWIKADAFLAKPIRFEQLKREIDRLLRK